MFGLKARNKQILCLWSPTLLCIFVLFLYLTKSCNDCPRHRKGSSGCLTQTQIFSQNDSMLVQYVRQHRLTPPSKLPYNLNKRLSGVMVETQRNVTAYLKKVLNQKQNGFFVESVALDGELFSQTLRLEQEHSWDGLLIEPMPSLVKILRNKQRKAWVADVCLSGGALKYVDVRTIRLYHSRYSDVNGYYQKLIKNENGLVQCFPLFSLISAIGLRENVVDLLNLYAAGAEYEILESIPYDSLKIRVIILNESQKLGIPKVRRSIRTLLEAKGYTEDKGLVAGLYMAFVLNDSVHSSPVQP